MRPSALTLQYPQANTCHSNHAQIKATSFLVAGKVGSASHLQERKGGSSWKLVEQVNCMEKSVEEGIHISLPFITWGRSLANHPLS